MTPRSLPSLRGDDHRALLHDLRTALTVITANAQLFGALAAN